jgi:hypothetical protein
MTIGKFSGLDTTSIPGRRTCQCSRCHELFSGESTFVWHRIAAASRPRSRPGERWLGECQDPASKGMVLKGSAWTSPDEA